MEGRLRKGRLKALRKDRGFTPGQLAYKAGISRDYVYLLEDGGRPNPSGNVLAGLATALDTSVDYLIGLTDDPRPTAVLQAGESKALAQSVGQLLADNSGRHLIELLVTMEPEDVAQVLLYARYIALRQQTGDLTIAELSERLFDLPR